MRIDEVISAVKGYCLGISPWTGEPIDEATTRDKVTYGTTEKECTGIVTCIWPTADTVRQAMRCDANLIISHEALFWNHGDHQDVIGGTRAYAEKKALLDEWGGTVWRCHDYIHSGVPIDGGAMVDGIFYGFAKKMGWQGCRVGDVVRCRDFEIPQTSGVELARLLVSSLGLNGTRITGDSSARVRRVHIPKHVMGDPASDTYEINFADSEGVDALVTMEFIDFTTCEYIRDVGMLGEGKCAITVGHFDLEEPGMELMAEWLPQALGTSGVPVRFVPMGDTYQYVVK
ncbi:Nif3-like dinuclear metal center hexameric protein [Tractidigestivibacter sp.]|uniref:Nif3-like dinuclear metal center hexameric protein n=1 Tax=Tractidigestivibacter sp. TaxID=2847320 RepID=UPI003FD7D9D5